MGIREQIEKAMKESVTETIYASGWGITPQVTDLLECAYTKGAEYGYNLATEKVKEHLESIDFEQRYLDSENSWLIYNVISDIQRRTPFIVADCIIWKKQSAIPNNVSPNKLTRICEFVFVLCRKNEFATFKMNKSVDSVSKKGQTIYSNVFNFIEAPNNDGSVELNKATFSSELVRKLLLLYCEPNAIVFDSFMGTGTTAIGALEEKMQYIGSELSALQCEYANNRIKKHQQQLKLF